MAIKHKWPRQRMTTIRCGWRRRLSSFDAAGFQRVIGLSSSLSFSDVSLLVQSLLWEGGLQQDRDKGPSEKIHRPLRCAALGDDVSVQKALARCSLPPHRGGLDCELPQISKIRGSAEIKATA